jgi:hypothetical protein
MDLWLKNVYEYVLEGMMPERCIAFQKQYLVQRAQPFVL